MSHQTEAERFSDIFDEPVGFVETVDQSEFIPDDTTGVEFATEEFLESSEAEERPDQPANIQHVQHDHLLDDLPADLLPAVDLDELEESSDEATSDSSVAPLVENLDGIETMDTHMSPLSTVMPDVLAFTRDKLAIVVLVARQLAKAGLALSYAVITGLVDLTQRRNGTKPDSAMPVSNAEPDSVTKTVKVKSDGRSNGWPMIVTGSLAAVAVLALTNGTFENVVAQKFSGVTSASPIQAASTDDPVVILTNELAAARAYAGQHSGSFTGYIINAPVKGAAGGPHLVLTVKVGATCWSSGITPGYPDNEVRTDPTGQRCDAKRLAEVQAQINNLP